MDVERVDCSSRFLPDDPSSKRFADFDQASRLSEVHRVEAFFLREVVLRSEVIFSSRMVAVQPELSLVREVLLVSDVLRVDR